MANRYRFRYQFFSGNVTGWWLVVKATDQAAKIALLSSTQFGGLEAVLMGNETICINPHGGYHFLTPHHNVVSTRYSNELVWPHHDKPVVDALAATLRDRDDAKDSGYATFNNGPHLCIDVPNGPSTISCKLADGRQITIAFSVYKEGEAPQVANVQYHSNEVNDVGTPIFPVEVEQEQGPGRSLYDSNKVGHHPTLVIIPLGK